MTPIDSNWVNDVVLPAKKKLIYATFSKDTPLESSSTTSSSNKVNLFASTPPSVIRSIIFVRPLLEWTNWFLSLLTWTSNDPWNSFLLVICWWILVFNIETLIIFGPWIVIFIMVFLFIKKRKDLKHEQNKIYTQNDLDIFIQQTDFFKERVSILTTSINEIRNFLNWSSPQLSVTIVIRLLFISPFWIAMLLFLVSPRQVIFFIITIIFIWHAPWIKGTRHILWRSRLVRIIVGEIVGINFIPRESKIIEGFSERKMQNETEVSDETVKYAFILWENQRKWIGFGWTCSMFPHERTPWTDEDGYPSTNPDAFPLPKDKIIVRIDSETGLKKKYRTYWEWIDKSWIIEHSDSGDKDSDGWVYTDNLWKKESPKDDFKKYTRRRKWIRNAELLEVIHEMKNDIEVEKNDITKRPSDNNDNISETQLKNTDLDIK
ncbi:hypothetical protein T552_00751 [Pneumocystis carinii B80]|uniref:Peroxin/Ferlin domain-containing protein n=1 Tax=Pneumocystis carinii (strain B80) TaxID=1408658 RepID=A0A0W4ZPH4_PNEC8|nr:hypothetical protein T552_00751 [Pneumocystis carinii B80]KTW30275.1 hypothetical protein T552_00751 [Pneumocystis carinii B80]